MHDIRRSPWWPLAFVVTLVSPAFGAEQSILGKTLKVRNPGTASRRVLVGMGHEASSPNSLVGSPTVNGAVLEVLLDGGSPTQQAFILPAGLNASGKPFWSALGSIGFRYKDTQGANGPVSGLMIQRRTNGTFRIKVKASGAHGTLSVVPPDPGTGGCMALTLGGGDRYPVAFGPTATIANSGAKSFSAKHPTAEGTCNTVPTTTTITTTSTTTTTLAGACPSGNFLDVAAAPGPGGSYPSPTLAVSCNASTVTVQTNGIPHFTFVSITPNGLSAINQTIAFPRYPQVAASTTSIPLLGTVGVTVAGIPLTGPNEAAMPDPYGDPVANAIVDGCLGHTAPGGAYHAHALVEKCLIASGLVAQPWNNPDPPTDARSPILGYALDGFPIYGPYECSDAGCATVYEALSGYDNVGYTSLDCTSSAQCTTDYVCATSMISGIKRKACIPKTYAWTNNQYSAKAGSEYLDQCNGHVGPGGDYHYHATATFPYALGCYRGTP